MPEYIDRCKKCSHFQVCANVMKNQLFIREKMLLEENPECEHFVSAEDVVEVRHGKWIRDSLTGHISCSNCKMTAPGDCELEDFYESDFCPMCGAKMDGKENGNNGALSTFKIAQSLMIIAAMAKERTVTEMTDKMTPMAARTKEEKNKWQIQPICKSCFYRRELRGFKYAVKDWLNTCCCYILIEGQLRGCQPHGNYCERYKPRPKRKGLD